MILGFAARPVAPSVAELGASAVGVSTYSMLSATPVMKPPHGPNAVRPKE
ncbi:MAG: hypothetical protein JRH10_20085 [Deltaproteobacteria bacterium]|nr:hypothetical protein [Deltaproteobacteria bacterium]